MKMSYKGLPETRMHWTGIGSDEQVTLGSPEDATGYFDLAWKVHKEPVYRKGMRLEKEKFYVVRDVDDTALGVVGTQYEPLQNLEAIEFLWLAVEKGDLVIERMIPIRGGRRIIMVAKRPDHILIADEPTDQYMVFSTGHTGEYSFLMQSTAMREFCMNIFRVKANPRINNVYKLRHVRNLKNRAHDMVKAFSTSNQHMSHLKELGDSLAATKITSQDFDRYISKLIPVPEEVYEDGRLVNKRAIDNARERQIDLSEIYYLEENLNDIRGTAWGAFQAVVQYNDWSRTYRSPERRIERIVDGKNNNQRALDLLIP